MEGKEQGEAPCCHLFSLLVLLGGLHLEGSPLWSLEEIQSSGPAVGWLPVTCFQGVLPPVPHSSTVKMEADICGVSADRAQRPF